MKRLAQFSRTFRFLFLENWETDLYPFRDSAHNTPKSRRIRRDATPRKAKAGRPHVVQRRDLFRCSCDYERIGDVEGKTTPDSLAKECKAMKRYQLILVLCFTVLAAMMVAPVWAQVAGGTPVPYRPTTPATTTAPSVAPAPPVSAPASSAPAPGSIVLINVAEVFEGSQAFQNEMLVLNQQIEASAAELQAAVEQLRADVAELAAMAPEARSTRETQLAEEEARIRIQQQAAQRDFRVQEAQIYYRTFVRIQQAISQYATHYQLAAVIRFNAQTEVNPDAPEQVLQEVNRSVLWHNSRLDITGAIQSMVNSVQPAPSTATAPRGGLPATR